MQQVTIKFEIIYCFLNLLFLYKVVGQKPNIVIIMADDLGMNDVSFRGSNQILTPNIDALGYYGVILDRFYVPALCTPSRAAILTGKHPIHTGMQHYVIPSDEPWGLPLNFTILPEIFRDAGYSTNLIGKWHLGFFKRGFTPTQRGFDYHFGYYGGYIDYYDHSLIMLDKNYSRGFDMRKNMKIAYETNGTYATDLFNEEAVRIIKNHDQSKPLLLFLNHLAPHTGNENNPMQAPQEEIEKHGHISDIERRTYAAMISKLDEGIGKVITALAESRMLDNSIVIFYSDNGAPTVGMHANKGSNYPLRGQKETPWEGGIRTPAVIWSSHFKQKERIYHQPMYTTDWLPTLASAAGIKLDPELKLDGHNIWDQLSSSQSDENEAKKTKRQILHNIDEIIGYSAYMNGAWKYINGTTENGIYDIWLGQIAENETDSRAFDYTETILKSQVSQILQKLPSVSNYLTAKKIEDLRKNATIICPKINIDAENTTKYQCNLLQSPCLFNIEEDPCEHYNLAWKYPNILEQLKLEVEKLRKTAIPSVRRPLDPNSDPRLHNYTWTWWQDDSDKVSNKYNLYVLTIILGILIIFLCIGVCIGARYKVIKNRNIIYQ